MKQQKLKAGPSKSGSVSHKQNTGTKRGLIIGALAIVVAVLAHNIMSNSSSESMSHPIPSKRAVDYVPIINIDNPNDVTFVDRWINKQLTINGEQIHTQVSDWPWPAIFRGTAVTRWPALRTWRPEHLRTVLG